MRYPENTIRFDEKPRPEVIKALKHWGFSWNRYTKCWYAPQSIESATVIDCIRQDDLESIARRVAEANMLGDLGII